MGFLKVKARPGSLPGEVFRVEVAAEDLQDLVDHQSLLAANAKRVPIGPRISKTTVAPITIGSSTA